MKRPIKWEENEGIFFPFWQKEQPINQIDTFFSGK